jgi:hypothetical protein
MWILNSSTDFLETLSLRMLATAFKHFSTICTSIPHTLVKSRITEYMQCCLSKKNGEQRYFVIGRDKSYFVKSHAKSNNK